MLRKSRDECLPHADPTERPDYIEADAQAIRAIERGDANADQQKAFLQYLIFNVCGTYDMAFRPGSTRDTDFALGKQKVGMDLVWLLKTAPTKTNPDKISARKLGEQQ